MRISDWSSDVCSSDLFRQAAARVIAAHSKTWRNEKHEKQWLQTLESYVFPHIGHVQVHEITGPMIRNLLSDIWLAKPETARRVRQRIGTVLDWAYASGYRASEAPTRSEEHTSELQSLMRLTYSVV